MSANTGPNQMVFVTRWKEENNAETQKQRWYCKSDESVRKMCLY